MRVMRSHGSDGDGDTRVPYHHLMYYCALLRFYSVGRLFIYLRASLRGGGGAERDGEERAGSALKAPDAGLDLLTWDRDLSLDQGPDPQGTAPHPRGPGFHCLGRLPAEGAPPELQTLGVRSLPGRPPTPARGAWLGAPGGDRAARTEGQPYPCKAGCPPRW